MKKIIVSLVLIFNIFWMWINFSNAENNIKQEKKINNVIEKFLSKVDKYEYNNKVKKITNILLAIEKIKSKYKRQEIKSILDYIYNKLNSYIEQETILKYYSLIEQWELEKAFKMKIVDAWDENFDENKELEKLKKIYNFWEKVKINVLNIIKNESNYFEFKVQISYLKSWKIEKYNVIMSVNPAVWLLPLMIKTIWVKKMW